MRLTAGEALRWERGRLGRMLNRRILKLDKLQPFSIQYSKFYGSQTVFNHHFFPEPYK